jgi:hypothetical protein
MVDVAKLSNRMRTLNVDNVLRSIRSLLDTKGKTGPRAIGEPGPPQGGVMSNNAAWLVLSFAIMAVAVLATLYETFEGLAKRLSRLEAGGGADCGGSP